MSKKNPLLSDKDRARFQEIVLEQMKIGLERRVPALDIRELTVENAGKLYGEEMTEEVIRFFGRLPMEPVKKKTLGRTVLIPSSWWQMFKQRYFPEWLKRRFPIDMDPIQLTVSWTIGAVYPQLPFAFPKGRAIIPRYDTFYEDVKITTPNVEAQGYNELERST